MYPLLHHENMRTRVRKWNLRTHTRMHVMRFHFILPSSTFSRDCFEFNKRLSFFLFNEMTWNTYWFILVWNEFIFSCFPSCTWTLCEWIKKRKRMLEISKQSSIHSFIQGRNIISFPFEIWNLKHTPLSLASLLKFSVKITATKYRYNNNKCYNNLVADHLGFIPCRKRRYR